ncbi:amidase (plasmid) [Rhodococcus qingshengii]|uniref:amidase n=1 Tax=Rhodococcus qingshengii TaxID=334542 RepID=UPI0007E5807C|nr:amidase [Rhodococcus qingshengii]BCF86688.1 amidase [Rhodococcus qingshengii]
MTTSSELALLSAAEISQAVRTGELSPVETTAATIDRIEQRNPTLNAVTYKGYDDARTRARDLESRIVRGEDIGVLAGVPSLMKDLFGFKPGWPATLGGLSALRNTRADTWSTFPARVEAAGSIVVGQTNSPAFGFRGTTDNSTVGPTRNPFCPDRNPGGSSGGSAAAVADGMVSIAGATDGGGSIRIPSAWSGVVGFQPSAGRVPFVTRPNAFGTSCFLYEGPITRSVEDSALAMTALSGFDPRDPLSLDDTVDFMGALTRGVRGKRIGYTPDYGIFPVEAQVRDTVATAVRVFEELGAIVEPVDFEIAVSQQELSDMWSRTTALGVHETLASLAADGTDLRSETPQELPASMMQWVDLVPTLTVDDLIRDQRMRTHVYDRFTDVFATYDYIVAPTLACMPVLNGSDGDTRGPSQINGEAIDPLIGWCMTYFTNFTGNPSASVPAGLSNGLPVGMLVMGRKHDDAGVMAAIAAFEQARPWAHHYSIPGARSL